MKMKTFLIWMNYFQVAKKTKNIRSHRYQK